MEKRMGTLADDKDGEVSPDTVHSPEHDTETMDEDRIPDTETPNRKCPTCGRAETNFTVKGSENSTIKHSTVIGVSHKTVIKKEQQQEGVTCNVTGAKPRVKISVPAEDGGTLIHVECISGKLEQLSYSRKVDTEKKFGSRWIFRNIFDGFMAVIINEEKSDDFFDLIEKWEERYGCEVHKVYKECLVIEFLHETAEGRDKMIKEKETVKQMFQTFIEGINPNASSCTLEVSTEKETTPSSDKPDTELKHIEQDWSVPSTSKSEQAQAQGMMPRQYKKEEQLQSVSDDESELLLWEKMKYSDESGELTSFRMESRSFMHPSVKAYETETSSQFFPSFAEMQTKASQASLLASEPQMQTEASRKIKEERQMQTEASRMTWRSEITDEEETSSSFHSDEEETSSSFHSDEEETSSSFHYFGLQPIPVSHVHLCDCRRCSEVLRKCENELSTLPNLFFIHFDPTLEDVRLNDSQLQFTKILSAFRNSQGGVLIVHQHKTSDSGLSLHKFINQILDSVLTHDLVTCDVFKSQQIGNYEDVFRIDVEPAEMYVTHDYKTKFPSLSTDKFENASNERIRHLLFSPRTTESTVPALKDFPSRQQNVEELRLRGTRPIPMLSYTSKPPRHMLNVLVDDIDMDGIDVDDIMTSHSVPEHITSLSKKKSGGSMFVVMPGLKVDDTPLRQQERFKARLMQTLTKNLRVQKNKHSKVSLQDFDVFEIGLSKDADSGDCILEIAVGHVNGCVFYDPQGPESYKIEGEKIVRLPIERWVEEAFE